MWLGKNKIPYVFLCNANFGILKRDVEIAEFFAEAKEKFGHLEGVSTQNAKTVPCPHGPKRTAGSPGSAADSD